MASDSNLDIDLNESKNKIKKTFYRNIYRNTPYNTIVNLSSTHLTHTDQSVLNKGLKFVPTPTFIYTEKCVNVAFENLCNRMSTAYYFYINPQPPSLLHRKSNWIAPSPKNVKLLAYFELTKKELLNFCQATPYLTEISNLTHEQKQSLTKLSRNKDIVIKKADKGGAIVIMNKCDYVKKAYDLLSNKKHYLKIETDPTKDLKTNIESYIDVAVRRYHISKQTAKFIKPTDDFRVPIFYILPKIHKMGTPGRPIVSAIKSVTENISEFLTLCIQPLLPKLRSYVKDTKHFVSIVTSLPTLKQSAILVSADVTSLYTNIPHNEGIDACTYYMKKYKHELPAFTPREGVIRMLFIFILENNYFQFLDEIYLQILGTAMGTKVAPPYASLFLGFFEERNIFEKFPNLIAVFLRFLDDIFFIWDHGEEELNRFFTYLNSLHSTIKFTYQFSREQINFLDTTVYIDKQTRKLKTKLYIKPTDTRSFLHYDSYHPDHTKEGIVYSQALRYRLITTTDEILLNELLELKSSLLIRGYPSEVIDEIFTKTTHLTQKDLLHGRRPKAGGNGVDKEQTGNTTKETIDGLDKKSKGIMLLPFIIPFHKLFLPLKEFLLKHWYIIENDKTLKEVFPEKPFLSFTKHKNIHDCLIKSKLPTN